MPGKKLSGAQSRKRKNKFEKQSKKYSKVMASFLKTAKTSEEQISEISGQSDHSDVLNIDITMESYSDDGHNKCRSEEIENSVHLRENAEFSLVVSENVNDDNEDVEEIERNQQSNKSMMSEGSNEIDNNETSQESVIPTVFQFHDIGYLKFDHISKLPTISNSLRTEIITKGPRQFQNKDVLHTLPGERSITKSWFQRRLANGIEINRCWLLYSPSKKSVYCFCCLLFTSSSQNTRSSFETANGFNKWRKPEKLTLHEKSPSHRTAFTSWKEAERRITSGTGVDVDIQFQIQSERKRWRDILKRILACIKFCASQNLALRGHDENLRDDQDKNLGNFLSLLKLVAQFDPLLESHLSYAKDKKGSVSYLSPEIQNEFISILADTLRKELLKDIKRNKYFAMLLDSTPDLAHREQLSEVIRYVDIDFQTKKVTIKESFLGYIEMHAKDAFTLENVIVKKLESDNMQISDCRAQCYDNASVMSGHISGLQQRMLARNHRALFVNCDNHSLNLAGVHAAKTEPLVITFFGTIQNIYVFFSRSTIRWEKMTQALSIAVKCESETRWSAKAEAVKAIYLGLTKLVELLEKLADDQTVSDDTRGEAESLLTNLLNFNFITLLHFWHIILGKIDRVQKRLQDPTMNFKDTASDLESLKQEFVRIRDDLCRESIESAQNKCIEWGIEIDRRIRRRRRMPGETARDAGLSAKEEIERVMKTVIDKLHHEINTRFLRLSDLNSKFGWLLDVKSLINRTNKDVLLQDCLNFSNFYDTDVDGRELFNEIGDCRMLLATRQDVCLETPLDLLHFVVSYGEDVFPNLRIAEQILLTIAVSIAGCERSFSKLKLILTYLRASMGQDRLNNLALLSIERDMLEKINFDNIIDLFASVKARKINFL